MAQGYHDFVAGEVLSAANLEDYCQNQSTMRFASAAARDAALAAVLTEGLRAYLIDLNVETVYSGSAWSTQGPVHGALTSFTFTASQSTTPTWTTNAATYQRVGRDIHGDAIATVASGTGTGANDVVITLPVTSRSYVTNAVLGTANLLDTSAGFYYHGTLVWISSTTAKILIPTQGASQTYLGTNSFTAALAVGDQITMNFRYEAAADA